MIWQPIELRMRVVPTAIFQEILPRFLPELSHPTPGKNYSSFTGKYHRNSPGLFFTFTSYKITAIGLYSSKFHHNFCLKYHIQPFVFKLVSL